MIKVLFDHQAFTMQRFGGISRYFANLHHYLNNQPEVESDIALLNTKNHYLGDERFPFSGNLGSALMKKQKRAVKWNRYYAKRLIGAGEFDIFHPTYYDPYFLSVIKRPFVITVHDMIHELFPEFFSATDTDSSFKRQLIEKAAHVIAISASTKRDIEKIYGTSPSKITVVHHGYSPIDSLPGRGGRLPYSQYILFVGERIRYKNFSRFLKAYATLHRKSDGIHLLCAGGGAFGIAEKEQIDRYGLTAFVHQISATDSELQYIYQQALLFVYPSLYEGFGLPLLEAFGNGCPVAVSNTSCFREVGGDAVAYFDPYSIEDMATIMQELIEQKELAAKLSERGADQLKRFTMEQCFSNTLNVYEKALGHK